MSIINTLPLTLTNGTPADATQVMSLFAWIQSQVNGNAAPAAGGIVQIANGGTGQDTAPLALTALNGVDLTNLADTADPTQGAGLSGFNFSLNYAANTLGWGTRLAALAINILQYLPVSEWGAIAGGTSTYDCGPAFRTALSDLATVGGGKLYVPTGKYLFNTWDTTSFYGSNNFALFTIPANVEFFGDGPSTQLLMSTTAHNGIYNGGANRTTYIALRTGQDAQHLHDFALNANGVVNLSTSDAIYGIFTMDGNALIERITANQCPFRNAIVEASTTSLGPTIVRYCQFIDNGPNMTGNTISADYSAIYLCSLGAKVYENTIKNSANAISNAGGIEMHTPNYEVFGNYIENMYPAMYLGVQDGITISKGSAVHHNYIGFNFGGIELVDKHIGLKIHANYFEANADSSSIGFTDIFTPLSAVDGSVSSGLQTAVDIFDNYMDCSVFRDGSTRNTADTSVNIGALLGCAVHDNIFYAPMVAVGIAGNTTAANNNIIITKNILINVRDYTGYHIGYFSILAESGAGWPSAPVLSNIYIHDNDLLAVGSTTFSPVLVVTGAGSQSAVFTNIRLGANRTANILNKVLGDASASVYTPGGFDTEVASASTISIMADTTLVTGTAAISLITVSPRIATEGGSIKLVPRGLFTTVTGGNIALASTAVLNRTLEMTYDIGLGQWYPSY